MKAQFKVEGKAEVQFWIRAFQFDDAIEHAQQSVLEKAKAATVPIVSEYNCGRFFWQLFIIAEVDALGLTGGRGVLWLTTDPKIREEQVEECAKLANDILGGVKVHKKFVLPETPTER